MAQPKSFKTNTRVLQLGINRSPTNCAKCSARDICPLEYDGNEEISETQARKAAYVQLQLDLVGTVVDAPAKDPGQTQPWTLSINPMAPPDIVGLVQLIGGLEGMTDMPSEPKDESIPTTGGLGHSIRAAQA